jgi:hypothetical protein
LKKKSSKVVFFAAGFQAVCIDIYKYGTRSRSIGKMVEQIL